MFEDDLSIIKTVKIQGDGWLLNGTTSVPNSNDNKDCRLIRKWLEKEGNVPEVEFSDEQLEETRVQKIKNKAGEIILARYSEIKQRNVALGIITDEAYILAMKTFIANIRDQSNILELDKTKTSDDFAVGE